MFIHNTTTYNLGVLVCSASRSRIISHSAQHVGAAAHAPPARVPTVVFYDHTSQLGGVEIALLNVVRAIDRTRFSPVVVLGSEGMLR